jgi:hypothetical protein
VRKNKKARRPDDLSGFGSLTMRAAGGAITSSSFVQQTSAATATRETRATTDASGNEANHDRSLSAAPP